MKITYKAVKSMKRTEELIEKNKKYLWNPFTQMKQYLEDSPIVIERGEGIKLIDVEGNEYYDGVSSIWLNVHGHNVKELNEAIQTQLSKIAHSTLLGMASVPALELAEKLVEITPNGLNKVFYSDCGATAVEIAIKMAFQYWQNQGIKEKTRFVTMKNAYHGDTVGAMGVGAIPLFHEIYSPLLFESFKVPYPYPYRFNGTSEECAQTCLHNLEQLLKERHHEIAALIVEPLVQGAAGMIMMPDGFLKQVSNLCKQYNILLIADEVAVGFGRTGKMFACDHEAVTPDILTAGKGLTGGYLPLAVTVTTDEIYNAFYADYEELKALFHGHSYCGNQLGCAVALENIKLFEQRNLVNKVEKTSKYVETLLNKFNALRFVGDIRQLGLMVGIELVKDKATKEPFSFNEKIGLRVTKRVRKLGMIIRPLGNTIVFMPPLASTEADLKEMIGILYEAIQNVTEQHR